MPFGVSRPLLIGSIFLLLAQPAAALNGAWTSMGPDGGYVQSVTLDPVTPSIVYATASSDTLKSVDGGDTWVSINPPGFGFSPEVLVDPLVPTTIYICRAARVMKSLDAGATWTPYAINEYAVSSLAIDPITPSNLWVGGAGKIHRSTDGGLTWTATALPATTTEQVFELAVDPVNPATLYGATSFGTTIGIFKSTDAGASYTRVFAGVATQSLAVDPVSPSTVFAGNQGGPSGVYRSTNGGGSWTLYSSGMLSGVTRHGLAIDPTNPQIVYAGSGGFPSKVHKSTDGGLSWTPYSTGLPSPGYVQSLVIAPSNPATLLGAEQTGVVRSTDAGVTWSVHRSGIRSLSVQGVTADPSDANVLYVAASNFGILKSVDAGLTWTEINNGLGGATFVARVLVDPVTPSNLYAVFQFGAGILRSVDGGANWITGDLDIFDDVDAVAIAPSMPSTLYAATAGGVYKSLDGAASWTLTGLSGSPAGGKTIAVLPGSADGVFVGVGNKVYRSNDGGDTWASIDVLNALFGSTISAFGIDPTDSSVMYAGMSGGFFPGLFRSTDGGASWTPGPPASPTDIAFGPGTPSLVVAASQGSVNVSRNQGATWSNELDGLALANTVAVGGSTIYVGTLGTGLWQRSTLACTSDPQCDDLNLCTTDTCAPSNPSADVLGCVHTPVTCTPSDCHTATCQYDTGACVESPRPDNTACIDDGTVCTRDICKSGTCTHEPQVVTSCKQAPTKKSTLAIKNLVASKAALTWKWAKGDATSLAEVGNPFDAGASDYTLCGFDRSGPGGNYALAFSIQAPAGGLCGARPKPCWTAKGVKVRYKDKDRTPTGADTFEIVPGVAGTTKVSMTAKGLNLSVPTAALTPDVHLQLRRDDASTCWEAVFQTNVSKNLPGLFKAKSN